MKFFCFLLAVGFFFAVKAQDPEEKLQAEETLERLPELQDQDEALQGIQDGAVEDPGDISQRSSTRCSLRGGSCYRFACPRGTRSIGNCDFFLPCCVRF